MYCKKLLNRASVDRTISKQEAMCLLGQLTLTLCSDNIENVSCSPFRRTFNRKEGTQDNNTTKMDRVSKYELRKGEPDRTLH
jgi:hypothetical protein